MIKMTLDFETLKVTRDDFLDIVNGNKTAVVEINNQDWHIGDFLKIYEIDHYCEETGKTAIALITDIYKGTGIEKGMVMLNFRYLGRGE